MCRFGLVFAGCVSMLAFVPVRAQGQCVDAPEPRATIHQASGVFVQWEGPLDVRPQCDTDFSVDSSEPPNVVVQTLRVGGVPIDVWTVGRTRSEGLQPRDLQSVKSEWSTEQANTGIIVRIGTLTSSYPVRSIVGTPAPERISVDIKRPPVVGGNDPWSSVQIQTMKNFILEGGHVQGSVFVEPNNASPPAGGRIRGSIAGNQGEAGMVDDDDPRIQAFAIGEGSGAGGVTQTLHVGGTLWNARLTELPSTARLQAHTLTTRGVIRIKGPLNGTIRLDRLIASHIENEPQPTKITVDALDLAAEDPLEAPRLASAGKVIIAGGELSNDFFPCEACDTSGWPADSGTWKNSEITFDGDFGGAIYAWDTGLGSGGENLEGASVRIGRSMRSGMQGVLKAGAQIRTFKGNHSSPPIENEIDYIHIEIWGDTEAGPPAALIDLAGQLAQQEFVKVHGDHKGVIRAMYFYANSEGAGNASVWIGGHLIGLIESANLTDFSHNSCFRDNGTITVVGDVKETGKIRLTGHVGAAHKTDIMGNMLGTYYCYGGIQKKFAGRLHIYGDCAGVIDITPSMDSMRLGSLAKQAGSITIDGDLTGSLKLGGSNVPPCMWLGPGSAPTEEELCGNGGTACSAPPDCSGFFPITSLDPEMCCLGCGCLPTPPNPACADQTMEFWEDAIQHPGSLVSGSIIVGGKVTSSITLPGDIGENGSIRVRSIEGGNISLGTSGGIPAGIRAGGSITVVNAVLSGDIGVQGDVAGAITMGSLGGGSVGIDGAVAGNVSVLNAFTSGQVSVQGDVSGIMTARSLAGGTFDLDSALSGVLTVQNAFTSGLVSVQGDVTPTGTITFGSFGQGSGGGVLDIDGALSGRINVNGQMRNALMSLNTGASGSQLNLGTTSTTWTTFLEGQTTIIDCGDINWAGTCDSTITLKGCYTPPPGEILFRSMCPADAGTLVMSFCEPAPVRCAP